MDNKGIMITGGTIHAGAMAAGKNASASGKAHPLPADTVAGLRAQMAAVVEELLAHADVLEDRDATITLAEVAQRELKKENPDKQSLLGTLQAVAAGVGSIASLASAVESIEKAASALF
jgi:hypothetical protein